jgi:signal transduction histidine kinase
MDSAHINPNPQLNTSYPKEFIIDILRTLFHDTRTPLQSMQALVTLIQEDMQNGNYEGVQTSLIQLQGLIHIQSKLFDQTTRAASNMRLYALRYEISAISMVIDRAARTIRPLAKQKDMTLKYSVSPKMPSILYLDPVYLYRILVNVLNNAVVHCPPGTIITLLCEEITEKDFLISISDNGPGIPAEETEQIFNPGVRLDTEKPGEGMGLAITRDLVRLLEGTIQLNTKPGAGTTVELRLPLNPFLT